MERRERERVRFVLVPPVARVRDVVQRGVDHLQWTHVLQLVDPEIVSRIEAREGVRLPIRMRGAEKRPHEALPVHAVERESV